MLLSPINVSFFLSLPFSLKGIKKKKKSSDKDLKKKKKEKRKQQKKVTGKSDLLEICHDIIKNKIMSSPGWCSSVD